MKYIDLLKTLIAFGPKLTAIWPDVLALIAIIKTIAGKLKPELAGEGGLQIIAESTPEEAEAEAQLSAALSAPGTESAFDGSRLRMLIAILQQVPELLALFKTLSGLFPAK